MKSILFLLLFAISFTSGLQASRIRTHSFVLNAVPDDSVKAKKVARSPVQRKVYDRMSEGISDAKLNGEPIIVQLDLPGKILNQFPDTVMKYLLSYYTLMEPQFPRSIADDFEHGISEERIAYPRLNFKVQLFEDVYAAKPYKEIDQPISEEEPVTGKKADPENELFTHVDVEPTIPPSGQDLRMYLIQSVKPPSIVKEKGITGISWVSFIIEKDGSLSDVMIQKEFSACPACDQEVLRFVNALPKLTPATIQSKPVRMKMLQGIRFGM